ncbi:MAG: hypothetical protein JNN12_16065 [Bacteroidetes Order II. Incertae sedis bacterium]|nr:hypothetical protein [Bacteroidetes Order II. bacterium]
MSKIQVDLENWKRRDHFRFFSGFSEPFFGVTVRVNVTKAWQAAKESGHSFFLTYLHQSLKAANQTEAFRYRIEKEAVFLYDLIHASPTINRTDGTFGFAYMDYHPDFTTFATKATEEIQRVRTSSGLELVAGDANILHLSTLPTLNFTGLSHARHFGVQDSIPKITFGQMTGPTHQKEMPISIHLHHGLADAYDTGLFVATFQDLLNTTD